MTVIVSRPLAGTTEAAAREAGRTWPEVRPGRSLYEALCRAAADHPDRPALAYLPTGSVADAPVRLTFGELAARVRQAANLFTSLGVGRRDVVTILAPCLPEAVTALLGACTAGIANPVNLHLSVDQLVGLLRAADTRVLVYAGPMPGLDLTEKVAAVRARLPGLRHVVRLGPDPGDEEALAYTPACAAMPAARLTAPQLPAPEDDALYFHTGGTTGLPKLAARTHDNDLYCAWAVAQMWHFTPGDAMLNVLPLFHVAGTVVNLLAPLFCGAEVVLISPIGLRAPQAVTDYWRIVAAYGITHCGGVPTNLVAVMGADRAGCDLSRLRYTLTGGAILPDGVAAAWQRFIDRPLTQIYGMTEAGAAIAGAPLPAPPPAGSVGIRFPFGSWCITPVDNPGGPPLPPMQRGQVVVRSPGTFRSYVNPGQNAGTLLPDGGVVTGDLGYVDADGFLYLNGRARDVIIRGGHNLDPACIEEPLAQHEAVALAAAVGRPDAYAGEVPVAYVQLKPGGRATPEDLRAWVAARISEPPAVPREVVVVEEMPLTAVGKIYKPALRLREAVGVARAVLAEAGVPAGVRGGEDALLGWYVAVTPGDGNPAARIEALLGVFGFPLRVG